MLPRAHRAHATTRRPRARSGIEALLRSVRDNLDKLSRAGKSLSPELC